MKVFLIGASKSQAEQMIAEDTIHQIDLDGQIIALVRQKDEFFAFQSTCPHRGASLLRGDLDAGIIRCSLHGYSFDLKSGEVQLGLCSALETYSVELTEEGLKISVPNE
ncbi:Rieske (2Fe-2S) protein [Algoriphagus winogradskyi]|uniref:Ferredoxin subunit of nitrite reductase or a ring-hydroxylating dioxygenase n=1 Tax=Algoriphagus winogradskyi TaxID=237017 RepID=A0ABY1NQP5_9BACT|nr:Rieske 2Fe-2S domain-containing protein [Algoriphagus winogradskyi]SMP15561.1 Ferredoxin subunit of nitrite reductase or a ring-hydroxylating dioxygenase [Algoriphagus winogradskyi]